MRKAVKRAVGAAWLLYNFCVTRKAAIVAGVGTIVLARLALCSTDCMPPAVHVPIAWRAASPARSVRVYFRAANARTEHYLEMQRDPSGRYAAVLPKANSDAEFVNVRIVTVDDKATRQQRRVAVTPDCAAPQLTPNEAKMADRLVIGSDVDAPSVPVGFACDGIIGLINSSGVLRAYDACDEQALAVAGLRKQHHEKGERLLADAASSPGLSIGPTHHRTPRRAPNPPTPPNPRLHEPVSPSRP